ncbi:unnamed protein product, partial [Heterosigma akashiwo]
RKDSKKDRKRDRDRSRDRDRDRRRRSRSRDSRKSSRKHRSRSRDRDRDRRRRSSSRDRRGGRDEEDEKLEMEKRQKERETAAVNELTKDQRTVFVSQLVMKAKERDLKNFFEQIGPVNGVIMIRDKYTNRHKGFAYVEMKELESIPACLLLNGQVPDFQKFPILVKASEAEKNFLAQKEKTEKATAEQRKKEEERSRAARIYVGNLHPDISEEDLKVVLKQCGEIESLNLIKNEQGVSKGYAFCQYKNVEDANLAKEKLAGLDLAGRPMKVGDVNTQNSLLPGQNSLLPPAGGGGGGVGAGGASGNWKLDDDGGQGMAMSVQNKVQLMAKLGQQAGIQLPPQAAELAKANPLLAPLAGAAVPTPGAGALLGGFPGAPPPPAGPPPAPSAPPPAGSPSFCFLIRNMFDPSTETEDGWDLDVKEDVEEECSKYGPVLHSYVEAQRPGGLVYLLFSTVAAAQQAAQALNGRWFAGRAISVEYLVPEAYVAQFPEASGAAQTAMATAANRMA